MSENDGLFGGDVKLFYFDDYVDQGLRLRQSANRKGQIVVFDDDFDLLSFVTMAHGGAPLPKISFVLDETLADGGVVEWTDGQCSYTWLVDREKLDALKKLIGEANRLPDLLAPFGIWQLLYRVLNCSEQMNNA